MKRVSFTLFSLPSLQMLSDGDYWLEIKAIIGGVLGFWGGVGGLGSLILVIVLSQVREIDPGLGFSSVVIAFTIVNCAILSQIYY